MRFENREFCEQDIRLDYKEFVNCKFINCNIFYSGGLLPGIVDASFVDCLFYFLESAQRTVDLLAVMANMSEESLQFVLRVILRLPPDVTVTRAKKAEGSR